MLRHHLDHLHQSRISKQARSAGPGISLLKHRAMEKNLKNWKKVDKIWWDFDKVASGCGPSVRSGGAGTSPGPPFSHLNCRSGWCVLPVGAGWDPAGVILPGGLKIEVGEVPRLFPKSSPAFLSIVSPNLPMPSNILVRSLALILSCDTISLHADANPFFGEECVDRLLEQARNRDNYLLLLCSL